MSSECLRHLSIELWESMVDHIVIWFDQKNDGFGVFNVHSIGLSYCNTMMVIILQNLESIVLVLQDTLNKNPMTMPMPWRGLLDTAASHQPLSKAHLLTPASNLTRQRKKSSDDFPSQNGEKIHFVMIFP